MASITKESVISSIDLINKYDVAISDKIIESEDEIDYYEDKLGSFLVKLSARNLNDTESNEVAELLHCIGDFERIGDHAINLAEVADEINKKKLAFSPEALTEINIMSDAVKEILELTFTAFDNNDTALAAKVEPLEQVIDELRRDLKSRHVKRLQSGKCTIELGFVLSDILTNFERISDHCSNIVISIIQIKNSDVDAHENLSELRVDEKKVFMNMYHTYTDKYSIVQ